MKVLCIKVPKSKAEAERRKLIKQRLLSLEYSPKLEGDFVYFPLTKEVPGAVKSELEPIRRKKLTLEDALKEAGLLSDAVAKSFDIMGDIALIEIPKKTKSSQEKKIAEAVMKVHPNIHVVAKKTGPISGEYRVRKLKVIAGEKRTETLHKEEGCQFKVDIANSYYSPRLIYERRRISALVGPGEEIFVPFAGVGPFAIIIAKNHPDARVWANELNPDAYRYMLENIKLNKTQNVIPIGGDAKKIAPIVARAGIGIKMSIRKNEIKTRLSKPVNLIELFLKDGDIENNMANIDKTIEMLNKKNIRVMLHEPFYLYKGKRLLLTLNDEERTMNTIECYKEMYKLCRRHPNVIGLVVHGAIVKDSEFNSEIFFNNLAKLSDFFDYVYLENNTTTIATKEDIIKTIKRSGIKNFCLDLSHLYITYKDTKKIIETARAVKSLCHTYFHIGDSEGTKDSLDIGTGKIDFKMIAESGLIDLGTIEVRSKDEEKGEEILASYDKFVSQLPQKKFDRIIMPIPMSSEKFLDVAFNTVKPGGTVHIYMFEKSEGSAVEVIKRYADKIKRKIKVVSTRIARDYSSNIIEVVVDFQILD